MKKKSVIIVSAVILIAVVIGAVFAVNHFGNKNEETSTTASLTVETTLADTVDPESIIWDNGTDFGDDDGLINLLFIGQDRREGEGRQRSDAMILCSLNPETNELSMISFMRDLYVQIPGYTDNRLNAAYAYGGFELLKSALKTNFGVSVDGCIEVDFEGFRTIVDTIGGVDIELTSQEAEIVGGNAEEGICHLDGAQTLTYVRIRKIDSDFVRTQRQRTVLKAIFDKVKNLGTTDLLTFAATLFPMVTSDVSQEELTSLALEFASSFDGMEVSTHRIPADGTYTNEMIRGMAVLLPDLNANKKLIFEEYLPIE